VTFIESKVPLVKWPSNSPDLSVIDNLWVILKIKVAQLAPKDMASLKAVLMEEWNAITQEIIDHLMESTATRFELCRKHNRGFIGKLLNQTRAKVRRNPIRDIPHGFTIPRKDSVCKSGQPLKVIGLVTMQLGKSVQPGPSSFKISNGRLYGVRLLDPVAFIPEG
jgi:hypothetical protein